MRRLSIKLRITLWFTLVMTLLTAAVLGYLFTEGERVVADRSRSALADIVNDSLHEIEFYDGKLEIDDDLDLSQDNTHLVIYDKNGLLLYGRMPVSFEFTLTLTDGAIQTVKNGALTWYIYDRQYFIENYGNVWVRGVTSSAASGNAFGTMLKLSMLALPLMVILAAMIGYLLIDRAFRPVRQITAAAERINDGDDLNERINLGKGHDEIFTLASTFDHMFDRLDAAFAREKQFTADASHELRTPTAVIISQCEYSLDSIQTSEETQDSFEAILVQARKISALISQLLLLVRADQEHIRLQRELIDFSELGELIVEQVEEQAAQKMICVTADIRPDLLLRGDETMLMRMLLNLMENGVKYGKNGGSLTLRLWKEKQRIHGEVIDDGIGIAPEHLPHIWSRFYQADISRSTDDGVGLGLSMVKHIAEAHGGSVDVSSVPGKGSTFSFILPIV